MAGTGIIGGTFDPPHNAHLTMADRAMRALSLTRVLFMPAPAPPHKGSKTPYETRVRMVELAIAGERFMELSRMEEFREGPSYTVDLLEFYRKNHKDDVYFIMGSDSLCDLGSWKEPERILELATLVVFQRPGFATLVPVKGEASIILFQEPLMNVSSSDIRKMIKDGEQIRSLLPDRVYNFVLDNSLYSC